MEGLIFEGAYVRREICISKSVGLTLFLEGDLSFFFVLLCISGQFPSTSPPGGLIFGGAISRRVFCVTSLGDLYLEGLIFGI